MTDTPSTDPADDDLLASLYLDGEATAAERARVEADPELMARVRSFEVIASDLSSVAPPPDLARLQINAALDAFDQQNSSSTPPLTAVPSPQAASTGPGSSNTGAANTVTSLSNRRERKQASGIPNWLAAAAALALVVGGIGFVSTLGGGGEDTDTASVALDSDDASASGANRTFDEAGSPEAESAETLMAESDAMDNEAMEDEAMEDDAMDDAAADEAPEEAMEEEAEAAEVETAGDDAAADEASSDDTSSDDTAVAPGPVPLDGLEATTAQEYFELLSGQPLRPIADSPCAESPLVTGLFGVDSFIEVVFDGEVSSLLVQEGAPSTAVIVGPTCQVELE